MSEPTFQRVATATEVPEGRMIEVKVGERSLVICHTREGWYALDNICTHAFARMTEGRLRGHRLICPLHGASFDCRTGAVLAPPASEPLRRYAVRLNGSDIEVALQP